ncbi:uncharacterized protein LOC143029945 [Oratosquilla oratoria]|uniref:uncharacterized protein LOC143029945 n=1 Tax=Oratosquilla oratoria TaxID=337810 RepID=UPI003F772C6E
MCDSDVFQIMKHGSCNLTYYGRVGTAYHLLVSGQQHLQPGSPCHVTFHARGGHYGDLVQLAFLTFNVGRFVQPLTSGTSDEEGRCIGGYVTLEEEGRPATEGRWCGEGRGRNVVFSEGPSLRLVLHPPLFPHHAVPSPEVILRYTMVRREDALLRYGSPSNPKNRGELVANTACSRVLTDCRSNNCRVQSPNYPGVYPRNLTCFYLVKLAPPHINREVFEKGHPRPVVVLSQPNDRLIQIGPVEGARLPLGRLKWENECRGDVLLVYDGGTTKAPLLARVCGGGAPLPNITASKSEVLVVFLVKASGPMTFEKETVTGFEIDISIAYLADSSAVANTSSSQISDDVVSTGPREALVTLTPTGPQYISSSPSTPFYISGPKALPSVWLGSTCRISDLYHAAAPPTPYASSTQPSSSASYPPSGLQCCHVVRSQGIGGGVVHSVQHAMPANSSCLLVFVAKADQVVWLYFIRYVKPHFVHPLPHYNITCHSRLAIVDGFPPALKNNNSSSVLGEFCGDSSPPLCVRARQQSTSNGSSPPPCRRHESFVSTGNVVSVVQDYTMTSALWPLAFSLRYEFVNARKPTPNTGYLRAGHDIVVDNEVNEKSSVPNYGWNKNKNTCSKVVLSSSASSRGSISSPDNVFLFGRGGQANLTCTFVFEQKPGERIAVRVTELMVRSSSLCMTHFNRSTSLPECHYNKRTRVGTRATLMVHEAAPWNGSDVDWMRLGCLCSQNAVPFTVASVSSTLMLTFSVLNMDWNHDHRHFAFEAEYEYKTTSRHCLGGTRTLGGTTGELLLGSDRGGFINPCHNLPWKITASPFTFLHLSVAGVATTNPNCTTTNRILLYNDLRREPLGVICPSNVVEQYVQVFSSGWKEAETVGELADESLIVRYLWRESGQYLVKWLEVQRSPRPSKLESEDSSWQDWLYSLFMQENPEPFCSSYCPDLGACIAPKLWCDGKYHCPSGADELSCLNGSLPWFYISLGSLVFLLFFLSFICITVSLTIRCFGKKVREADKALCRPEAIIPKANGVPRQENGGPTVERPFGCRRAASLPREHVETVYTISYTPRMPSITAASSIAADIRYATDHRA